MRDDLKTELVLGALGMAIRRRAAPGLVHHSDRGSRTPASPSERPSSTPARSRAWAEEGRLRQRARRGLLRHPRDRAARATTFHTRDHARIAIFHYIEGFHNTRRRHSALGNLSPDRIEKTEQQPTQNSHRCLTKRVNQTGASPTWLPGLGWLALSLGCVTADAGKARIGGEETWGKSSLRASPPRTTPTLLLGGGALGSRGWVGWRCLSRYGRRGQSPLGGEETWGKSSRFSPTSIGWGRTWLPGLGSLALSHGCVTAYAGKARVGGETTALRNGQTSPRP